MNIASQVSSPVSASAREHAETRGDVDSWVLRPLAVAASLLFLASLYPAVAAAGTLNFSDGKAHTISGPSTYQGANAISTSGVNTSLAVDNVTATSSLQNTATVSASNSTSLSISNSHIEANGTNGTGASVGASKNVRSTLTVSDSVVVTTGTGQAFAPGVRPSGAAVLATGYASSTDPTATSLNVNRTSVTTSGSDAGALVAAGGVINGTAVRVETSGADAIGARTATTSRAGGVIALTGDSSVTTSGKGSHGLMSDGRSIGIFVPGSLISMTDGTVTTSGDNAIGATAMGSGRIVLDNTRVQTSAVSATGASAASTGRIETTGGGIATTGDNASAMTAIDAGTTLATQGTTLATSGAQSHGISVDQNATASVNGSSIATSGAQSAGVVARSGGTLALSDTTVTTSGAASHGAVLSRSGGLTMTGTTLTATGDNAHGISVEDQQGPGTPESVSLTGGAVRSAQGSAIRVEGASLAVQAKGDAQLSGANVLDVRTGAAGDAVAVSFSGTDTVTLSGDIVSDAQSSVDVALDRAAAWTGAARNVGALSVSDDAVWNLNGDSNVASASLAGGSVNFTPSSDGSFRTLDVAGGWNASASNGRNPTVTLNTNLNEGGALSNQKTDRLLIAGDANGSTTLKVRAQGAGAFTSTSVTPGANEGISLVQVGGNASAQSFELQNGYVAVGPYQYRLSAFAPGASSAEQRLVAGSGDAFWDYRLNSVQVSEGGPSSEGNGSETPGNIVPPDGNVNANVGAGGNGTDTAGTGSTGATADSGEAVANNGNATVADATPAPIDSVVKPDTRALLVPQAPSYLAAKTSLTHHLIDALPMLHARNGASSIELDADVAASRGAYARTYGSSYTQHTDRSFMQYGSDFDMQSGGAQVGADVYNRKLANGDSVQFGVFGSYGLGRTASNAADGESRSSFDSIGGGVTATYRFSNGAYLDGVAKIDRLSDSFSTNGRDVASTRGMGYTFAAETGYARTLANNWFVDGRLALGMVNVSLADTTDADGIDVQFGSQTSAIGRVDARVGREFGAGEKRVRPYVRAGLEGVSGGNTAVMLSGYRFNGSGVGNSWIAGTGIDARFGKSTTLSVDGGYRGNLGAAGAEGLEGNLTFKKAF